MAHSSSSNTNDQRTYKDRKDALAILGHMGRQLEKMTISVVPLLKELKEREWHLNDIKDSGIKKQVKILSRDSNSEAGVLSSNILRKWHAQKLRMEKPSDKKKRGFKFETDGALKYGMDLDGDEIRALIMEGMTSDGKIFSIPMRPHVTITNIFEKLRKEVGLPNKYLRLEIDGIQIEKGKKLETYNLQEGQYFRLYRNDL